MKRKWIKIMIGLIILTGFALVPKERTRIRYGDTNNFLSTYSVDDTIKIQIVGYDENLNTSSSSLTASQITTKPNFLKKSLSSVVKGDGTVTYLLTLSGARSSGEVYITLPEGCLVDSDGNKNEAVNLKTNAIIALNTNQQVWLIKDGIAISYDRGGFVGLGKLKDEFFSQSAYGSADLYNEGSIITGIDLYPGYMMSFGWASGLSSTLSSNATTAKLHFHLYSGYTLSDFVKFGYGHGTTEYGRFNSVFGMDIAETEASSSWVNGALYCVPYKKDGKTFNGIFNGSVETAGREHFYIRNAWLTW